MSVYSVEQLNTFINTMFRSEVALRDVSVRGEISNCKYHTSGHIYFTLKDAKSAIPCVVYERDQGGLSFKLENGLEVEVRGSVGVFVRDGKYQLYAKQIKKGDIGELAKRFEELKARLKEEGLFDESVKQPIPKDVRRLGVVTAPTGAAVRDIISVSKRRNPYIEIILYPALVQGIGAKESIVKGIHALEEIGVDVMIVGRGGGSIEDLWAFNEEMVAQAIFNCPVPVISAVGHQTDVTIADFVADLRAPTPSAAAELAVEELQPKIDALSDYAERLTDSLKRKISVSRLRADRADEMKRMMVHAVNISRLRADKEDEIRRWMMNVIRLKRERIGKEELRLASLSPAKKITLKKEEAERIEQRLNESMNNTIRLKKHELALLIERFKRLSVLDRLQGGLGYVSDKEGRRKVSVKQFAPEEEFVLRLKDGSVDAKVLGISEDEMLLNIAGVSALP